MSALITIEELKLQLHIVDSDTSHDDDLDMKILQASAILLTFIHEDDVPDEWLNEDSPSIVEAPNNVKAAALLIASELYRNREASDVDLFTPTVRLLLRKYWDPLLA